MRRVAAPFIASDYQIPFHDQPAVAVDVHVSRRVIAFPRDEDVAAPPILAHRDVAGFATWLLTIARSTPCARSGAGCSAASGILRPRHRQ
jgi:hypothetical protein